MDITTYALSKKYTDQAIEDITISGGGVSKEYVDAELSKKAEIDDTKSSEDTAYSSAKTDEKYIDKATETKAVGATFLKTINGQSLIGYGDLEIGGESGTSDYSQLTNKPTINDVELNGDVTLEQLGIQAKGNYALKTEIPTVDVDKAYVDQELSKKVDSVQGKGLSSNDFTNADKAKVDAIPANPKYTDTVYDDTEVKDEISTVKQDLQTKYAKPSTGIAENDLSAEVKAKLNSNNGVTWRVEDGILYADYEEGE